MKTKIIVALLFLANISANAQVRSVLFQSLKNEFTIGEINSPEGFSDWAFNNCNAVEDGGDIWLQVGSSDASGSIITPELETLTGNARINVQFQNKEEENIGIMFHCSNGKLTYNRYVANNKKWNRIPAILLRDGTPKSRLRISTADKDGNDAAKSAYIANIDICDIGENIYWETFDRNESTGGTDGSFVISSTANLAKDFDYITSESSDTKKGYHCIALDGNSSSIAYFTTSQIPCFNTSSAKVELSFKVAGASGAGNHSITIYRDNKIIQDIDVNPGEWQEHTVTITNMNNSKITIQGYDCFLDEVRIRELSTLSRTLNDGADNSTALSAINGKVANVTLTRTLGAGYWNTLCLPFDFNPARYVPEAMAGAKIELQRLETAADGVFTFAEATEVPAGEPFLIRTDKKIENPIFENVCIKQTTPQSVGSDNYRFTGTYSITPLNTDGTNIFLGTTGGLHTPIEGDNNIGGLRAYFEVPEGTNAARIMLSDNDANEIHTIKAQTTAITDSYFNLMGMPVSNPTRGIYLKGGKKIIVH